MILASFAFCPWCGSAVKTESNPSENLETAFFPMRLYVLRQKIDALDEELAALSPGGLER